MADNSVFITGIADGAIEDALASLPAWANQETAKSIETILLKTLQLQTKTLSNLASKSGKGLDTKEVQTELDKLGKSIGESVGLYDKEKKFNKDKEDQRKKDKKYWDSEKGARENNLLVLAELVTASVSIKAAFLDNIKTFDELNAAGINVVNGFAAGNDGFESLREITALTGVRFTELSAAMVKYSSAVNSFGVSKFAKTVGIASSNLTQFGYSSKESAELLGQLLSIQQNTGDVSRKTSEEANEDLQKFGNSVFRLSLATGMSRAAIMSNIEALSKSSEANVYAGQVGESTALNMTEFLASFKDQNLGKQLLKLMSDPIKPLNDTFMNLQKVGMGGFAMSLSSAMKSMQGLAPEQKAMAYKNFVQSHRQELDQQKQRLAMLAQTGNAEAKASLDFIVSMEQQADATKDMSEEDIKRQMATNAASKDFNSALEKLKSMLQRAFGPTTTILNILTGALTVVNFVLESFIGVIDDVGRWIGDAFYALLVPVNLVVDGLSWLGEQFGILKGPLDSLKSGITMLTDAFSGGIDLTAWLGVAAIGIGLVTGMKTLPGLFNNLKSFLPGGKGAVGGLAEKATEGGGKGGTKGLLGGLGKGLSGLSKGIADVLKNIGSGIKDFVVNIAKMLGQGIAAIAQGIGSAIASVAQGIGKAAEGLLSGIGKGLAAFFMAFANPAILVGAAIFSGALLTVGAAIAGVTWLIGAVLPTLADGLSALTKVDGAGLSQVGTGLLMLGGGLFAFASALLLGGPSLVVGAVGITAFGLAALVAAPGISSLADSFSKMGNLKGIDNIKKLVDTVNSLDLLKAAAFAALSVIGIGPSNVTPPTNVSTGTAPKASTLNSPSAVSTIPGVGGEQALPKEAQAASSSGAEKPASGSSVETALGYQSSILQQLLESTNSLISVNKDILKYTKVNA